MKNNKALCVLLPIIAVIGGLFLNFQPFLMGGPATIWHLLVSGVYGVIWIFSVRIAYKSKNREIFKPYFYFWFVTLCLALLMGYVNVTGENADWSIPFIILFLTQWYGIHWIVDNFIVIAMIISLFSIGMLVLIGFAFKRLSGKL